MGFIMKSFKNLLQFALISLIVLLAFSCKDNPLKEKPYSQIAPENLLTKEGGVKALLASAYANASFMQRSRVNNLNEWTTDISWQTGGGENRQAVPMINYSWDPTQGIFNNWYNNHYNAIRDANTLLENIDLAQVSDSKKKQFIAEAKFVRAFAYYQLYKKFGPTPLRKSTQDKLELPRASDQEMKDFIESELLAAIPDLPEPGTEVYGRATKGAARGVLTKFYLNTKQWQKTADMAKQVMDMGYYKLYPSYKDMFNVENEGNKEMIWVFTADPTVPPANNIMNGTQPPGWQKWPKTGLEKLPNWNNWASQYRIRDAFYNSFEAGDDRLDPFMTEYINAQGDTVDLKNDHTDDIRAFKYVPTEAAQGNFYGNDWPIIRYADILLSRAEALNELNGPNPESINLINQVRNRSSLGNITLANYPTKSALRDHILDERGWEFYYEGKRREDLIRMGKLIDYAHQRGVTNADQHYTLFPIPQSAMDSNPALEQNPGY